MKIVFEKLQTSNKNIYVDFGDGTWQAFPVNDARANGITIPESCSDYSKIRIKGKADIFPNLDVITSIKKYEKVGQDFEYIPVDKVTIDNNNNTYHLDLGYMGQGITDLYFDKGRSDLSTYIKCEHIPYNEALTAGGYYILDDGYGYIPLNNDEVGLLSFIKDNPGSTIEDDGSGNEVIYIEGQDYMVEQKIEDTILVDIGSSLYGINNPAPFTDNGSGKYFLNTESKYFNLDPKAINTNLFNHFKNRDNYITELDSNTNLIYKGSASFGKYYEITDEDPGYDTTNFKNQLAEDLPNKVIYYKVDSGNYIPTNIRLTLAPDVTININ